MEIFVSYLKKNFKIYTLFFAFVMIFYLIFYLYNLPFEALYYAGSFCFLIAIVASVIDYGKYRESYRSLKFLGNNLFYNLENLPKSWDIRVSYYNKIIAKLYDEIENLNSNNKIKHEDLVDYYSMWVHQIKTPIAAMNFLLDNDAIDEKHLKQELFKIERYVEMVLTYLRLDSRTTDYLITKVKLANIVKEVLKKYATLFINKKIKLNFVPHETYVVSDKKWLAFAMEQILSNAIKYTKNQGEISIKLYENRLIIEDTGIGITKEDLPRIFEKGFTGFNGRYEKKSSGLGLYLCKKTLDNLGHKIKISSEVGYGTQVEIIFPKEDKFRE
ncbi:sensor histidine kinase [Gemella cuniculi]|uniref:sensor histidine kinase n=1 Tax=Gemella cuniculi TaxID=150240 RepID=UPI0003FBB58F|nr:sensor histidine kinase [Gemella cuniculi]